MMLSQRRKEVLIKLVAQAIPTYIIGCFLLPLGLREHIEAEMEGGKYIGHNGPSCVRKMLKVTWASETLKLLTQQSLQKKVGSCYRLQIL